MSYTADVVSPPLVSVIIPTRNRPQLLAEAIQAQTFTDFEIVLSHAAASGGLKRSRMTRVWAQV